MLDNDSNAFRIENGSERMVGVLYVCPHCGAFWIENWDGYTWTLPSVAIE